MARRPWELLKKLSSKPCDRATDALCIYIPEDVVHALLDGAADDEPVHHRRPLLADAVHAPDGLWWKSHDFRMYRGLSYKKRRFKRPKVWDIWDVWDV